MNIKETVRAMSPPRFTTAEAAELVGKHPDTIKRWRKDGVVVPSDKRKFGNLEVLLYTEGDIKNLRYTAHMMRPGRKAKVTDEQ